MKQKLSLFFLAFCMAFIFSLNGTEESQWNVYQLRGKLYSEYNAWTKQINWKYGETSAEVIALEDGSFWKISWWWQKKVKQWASGDRIAIYYNPLSYNEIYFKNLDRNEDAWGSLFPQFFDFNNQLRLIRSIDLQTGQVAVLWPVKDPSGKTIDFHSPQFETASKELFQETGWENDPVIILGSGDKEFPYWIYNIYSKYSVQHILVRPIENNEKSGS